MSRFYTYRLVFLITGLLSGTVLFSQQEATFTHYMFSKMQFNPAFANSTKALSISGIHRSQWAGFEGAPLTQSIAIQTPLFKEHLGLGVSILNDRVGPVKTFSIYADVAYKLKLGEKSKLSLGLKGGLSLMQFELNQLELENQSDMSFEEATPNKALPNVGFGLYYEHSSFYVGFASPRVLQTNLEGNYGNVAQLRVQRHYFLNVGAKFNLNSVLQIKPYGLVKVTANAPVQLDLTALFEYKNLVWFGPMFRFGDAAGLLVGANLTNQLRIGYSYDYSFGLNSAKYSGGSHEIMLRYDFVYKDKGKIQSPRYF